MESSQRAAFQQLGYAVLHGPLRDGGSRPEIFQWDQACLFTSADSFGMLQAENLKISWPGRGRCYDNILKERAWANAQV